MSANIKTAFGWKKIDQLKIKTAGAWTNINKGFIKRAGEWKVFFTSLLTPSIQNKVTATLTTSSSTGKATITGKLYHWNDATSVSYIMQKSSDDSNFSDILASAGTSVNPASGSSNTNDSYLIQQEDVTPNIRNYYRYVSLASLSTYGTSASSESLSVYIEGCRDITDLSLLSSTSTTATLTWTPSLYANRHLVYYKTLNAPSYTLFGGYSGTTSQGIS